MTPLFPIGVLLVTLLLSAVSLPQEWLIYWPHWMGLACFWFVLYAPTWMNVVTAWVLGVVLDLLVGTPLASHGFGLAVAVYILSLVHRRVRHLTLLQQMLMVACFCWVAIQASVWVRWLTGGTVNPLYSVLTSLVTGCLWPAYLQVMRRLSQRFA